jgi:Druantia protein DruA
MMGDHSIVGADGRPADEVYFWVDGELAGPSTVVARYCGRDFTAAEMRVIADLAAALPTRNAIADAVCDTLAWLRPDGRRKDMSARVALLRMADDGLVTLPPPRCGNGNGRVLRFQAPAPELPVDGPLDPALTTLDGLGPLRVAVVDTAAASRQWRDLIAGYHYLGYTPFAGAQLRYLVHSERGPVAALGFAASAWACAARDGHIGWDPPTREARLHLVVGNARFLILPRTSVPNLASHLLATVCRRLPADWRTAYGYAPVLVETFVETGRFTGASYRAANWVHVGQTTGRGKLDRRHRNAAPVKDVYLFPLHRHYRRLLTAAT